MESRNRYKGIHPAIVDTVRHHAHKLASSGSFFPLDVEDIEQEMMIHLHRQLPRYDASKASAATFISRLISVHGISLYRSVVARGVGGARTVSLSDFVRDGEGHFVELIETIPSDCSLWPNNGADWHEAVEARIDVMRFLEKLPKSLRQHALWLVSMSVTEVLRMQGISRHVLYGIVSRMQCMSGGTSKKNSDKSPLRRVCKQ
ncbi:MAG: hypothetical protein H7835_18085 [Magnetococcus sp. XQGC-1]